MNPTRLKNSLKRPIGLNSRRWYPSAYFSITNSVTLWNVCRGASKGHGQWHALCHWGKVTFPHWEKGYLGDKGLLPPVLPVARHPGLSRPADLLFLARCLCSFLTLWTLEVECRQRFESEHHSYGTLGSTTVVWKFSKFRLLKNDISCRSARWWWPRWTQLAQPHENYDWTVQQPSLSTSRNQAES